MNKITFFLMTFKGLQVLQELLNVFHGDCIYEVVVSRDRNVADDYYTQIRQVCDSFGVHWVDRRPDYRITTKFAIAVSWRWMIPTDENSTLIVLHDSILPKYRGFAPLVNMLINGEKELGVTALFADEEYDHGDIIEQMKIRIEYPIKIVDAIEKISLLYGKLVSSVVGKIISGTELPRISQRESDASYSLWRDEEDYLIDWRKPATYIQRFVDSVGFPYNGAKTYLSGNLVRITESSVLPDVRIENRTPGKILRISNGLPSVVCGSGLLQISGACDDKGESLLPLNRVRIRFG